jgi:hypothetical protein
MKITKEIKLENPKRCDGCPAICVSVWGKFYCFYGYVLNEITGDEITHERKRPVECIKENPEEDERKRLTELAKDL